MSIIVTGAAGFVGSALVRGLNQRGINEIIAVDNLINPSKFSNMVGCRIEDYVDKSVFIERLLSGGFAGKIEAILHQGACTDTMENNGRYMMDNNYQYSKILLDWAQDKMVPMIYASSASTYGNSASSLEDPTNERPLNIYAYSKLLFDQIVRARLPNRSSQISGLRYFNVYGPREAHKDRMASFPFHCFKQYRENGYVNLFEGSDGYGNGEQCRDFVYVDDLVQVNLWLLENPDVSGIFNVGTGAPRTFNEVAAISINACRRLEGKNPFTIERLVSKGIIKYISFPEALRGKYQSHTKADITKLRDAGYTLKFHSLEEGINNYMDSLN